MSRTLRVDAPRWADKRINKALWLLYILLLAGMGVFAFYARESSRFEGDLAVDRWIQSISFPLFDPLMRAISALGTIWISVIIVAFSIGVFWVFRRRWEAVFLLLTSIPPLINRALKELVDRPRPADDLVRVLEETSTPSFPSGHVVFAVVFFGLLFYLVSTAVKKSRIRVPIQVVLALIVLLMGPSRVYMGVHWPSDAGGGYVMGLLFVFLLVWLYRRFSSGKGLSG